MSGNTQPGWTHDFSASVDGAYAFLFRAVDLAGNVESAPAAITVVHVTPDTTPPDTSVSTAGAHFSIAPFSRAS